MNWYPDKRLGLACGLALLAALLLAGLSISWGVAGSPIGLRLFGQAMLLVVAVAIAAIVGYECYGLANLTYRVERNGVAIRWAAGRHLVPMHEIEEILPFAALGKVLVGGVGWPGYRIGRVQIEGVGPVRLYLTRPPEQALLVRTREQGYLISPANVDGFLTDYRARRVLGAIVQWRQGERLPAALDLSIWHDRLAGLLVLPGLLLNLALFGFLAARYPALPGTLPLAYSPLGLADRIGASRELFLLPAAGLGILLLNGILAAWVHRRERALALLLAANVPLVQVLVWLAAWRLAR